MEPAGGALPSLRGATDPDAASWSYWGPAHRFGTVGPPVPASRSSRARDTVAARRLWAESEQLTGVTYPFAVTSSTEI
jgi:hypothetical protein